MQIEITEQTAQAIRKEEEYQFRDAINAIAKEINKWELQA